MSLPAAILGFLDLQPMSGYGLKQRFEASVGSFWSVTQSQIYRELHALERERFVVVQPEGREARRGRKLYALSATGRRLLEAWLREPLEPVQLRHPLLLKLVFSAGVEPKLLDGLLAHYRDSLERTRDEYAARLAATPAPSTARSKRQAEIWRLSIEHGLAWCEVELAWLEHARKVLKKAPAKTSRKPRKN